MSRHFRDFGLYGHRMVHATPIWGIADFRSFQILMYLHIDYGTTATKYPSFCQSERKHTAANRMKAVKTPLKLIPPPSVSSEKITNIGSYNKVVINILTVADLLPNRWHRPSRLPPIGIPWPRALSAVHPIHLYIDRLTVPTRTEVMGQPTSSHHDRWFRIDGKGYSV